MLTNSYDINIMLITSEEKLVKKHILLLIEYK